MGRIPLTNLVEALEAGTSLHICIAFFTPIRTHLTRLPSAQVIHSSPFCTEMKKNAEQMAECYRTREKKFKRAKEEKTPFISLCPCGIREYLHPVVFRDTVISLVMISGKTPEDGAAPDFLYNAQKKAMLLEQHILHLMESTPHDEDDADPFAAQVAEILGDNTAEKISVREVAQSLGYHEKYFSAKFKKKTGKSPCAYRNERRLLKAEALLRNTRLSVIEIAAQTGFDNVSYFNRLFRARNGTTPTEYRKRNRK